MHKTLYIILLTIGAFFSTSCTSSIAGTGRIKTSRSDREILAPKPEDALSAQFAPSPLSEWKAGKVFIIADSKAQLVLTSNGTSGLLAEGDTITYRGIREQVAPDGMMQYNLLFECNGIPYYYNTGRRTMESLLAITSIDIPMLVDPSIAENADKLLTGKQLFLLTSLCYDENGNGVKWKKYMPVKVINVRPGDMIFPMAVDFVAEDSVRRSVKMSTGTSPTGTLSGGSRPFATLFSLTDPHLKHPNIQSEHWDLICREEVCIGMTKEECRLALGNPSDVDAGHNRSITIDIWRYKAGSFLLFNDGLLVDYRN